MGSKTIDFIIEKENEVENLFKDWHIEKLASVMEEYGNEKTQHQAEVIERLKNMSGILLERLEKAKPIEDYRFSVRIAIKDLERAVKEAESLLKYIE